MNRPLILVVEDNPTQQKLFSILADRLNYTPQIVGSATEMLDALSLTPLHSFALVLMDWRLDIGELSGLECTNLLRQMERQTNRHIPIIGMTAYAMAGDKQTCLEAGMDDYLTKPFTINQLSDMLQRWLPNPRFGRKAV